VNTDSLLLLEIVVQIQEHDTVRFLCDDADEAQNQLAQAALLDDVTATDLAAVFQTLSDPTRVRIISLLARHELCVHAISAALEMSQSAISHQLRTMRVQRLVRSRKAGRHVYYRLDGQHITDLFQQGLAHLQHTVPRR
jgi:ArsR family transcriptional regulator